LLRRTDAVEASPSPPTIQDRPTWLNPQSQQEKEELINDIKEICPGLDVRSIAAATHIRRAEAGTDFHADRVSGQQSKSRAQHNGDGEHHTMPGDRIDRMVGKAPALPTQFKDLSEDRPERTNNWEQFRAQLINVGICLDCPKGLSSMLSKLSQSLGSVRINSCSFGQNSTALRGSTGAI
jgi:hypothetical protein